MGTQVDLSLLALFAAVAHAGGFTRAAARLSLPKSTVSRGVARLEEGLGQQLLYRTTRQVKLTPAGAALFERAAPHLVALQQAVGTLPAPQTQPSGVLRLTAPNDLGTSFLAELSVRFCGRYPAVRLEVELTGRKVDLVAEGFDLALRAGVGRLSDSTLVARKVSPFESQLFASPAYLARRGLPRAPRDLAAHEHVSFRNVREPLRLYGPGGTAVLDFPPRMVADDFSFVREVLRSGGGVGALPSFLAREDLALGTLVRVLPRHSVMQGALYIVHPAARHVPRSVSAFRDFVVEALAARPLGAMG
jgi:DNA-binding transcriptional LysR family regulator